MASTASEEVLSDIRIFFACQIWRKFLPGIWNPNLKNSFHYNATPTPHITYKKLSPQSSNMMNLQENSTVVASNSPLSRVNPTTHWETDSEFWNWLRLIRGIIYFCVLTSSNQLSEALRFTFPALQQHLLTKLLELKHFLTRMPWEHLSEKSIIFQFKQVRIFSSFTRSFAKVFIWQSILH